MATVMVVCRGKPRSSRQQQAQATESYNYLSICGLAFMKHKSGFFLWLGLDIRQRSRRNAVWDDDGERDEEIEEMEECSENVFSKAG